KRDEHCLIIGLDNLNDYYDVALKHYRLNQIKQLSNQSVSDWTFIEGNLADKELINSIFEQYNPEIVVNLAAQAGVRYSITNPDVYIESNI
ncbi:GDP-mannose 4,6-dehydratase, partial [Streptococcus suis]